MSIDVVDTTGNRSPFSLDRFTGWLVRAGLASGDALAYSRAIQVALAIADLPCITTSQLRACAGNLVCSSAHELAVDSLLRSVTADLSTSCYLPVRSRGPTAPGGTLRLEPLAGDLNAQPGPFLQRFDMGPGNPCGHEMSRVLADEAHAAVLGSGQVREMLEGKRYTVISIDFDHTRCHPKGNPLDARVVLYNYTDDVCIEAIIELSAFQVRTVNQFSYQPSLTTEELQHAIELAAADGRVTRHLSPEMIGTGILMRGEDRSEVKESREVLVLFGRADQREAAFWALVDLSADAVREAGDARGAVEVKEKSA
jgi:hypothetical protein